MAGMLTQLWAGVRGMVAPMIRRPDQLQVAALCRRDGPQGPEILLVRSLDSRRWIVPKGWPMTGRTLAEAAAREAWEEAGVTGEISADPVATYRYRKGLRGGLQVMCDVHVYTLSVTSVADSYPEAHRRERRWISPAKAARKISEPGLRSVLRALHPRKDRG